MRDARPAPGLTATLCSASSFPLSRTRERGWGEGDFLLRLKPDLARELAPLVEIAAYRLGKKFG